MTTKSNVAAQLGRVLPYLLLGLALLLAPSPPFGRWPV